MQTNSIYTWFSRIIFKYKLRMKKKHFIYLTTILSVGINTFIATFFPQSGTAITDSNSNLSNNNSSLSVFKNTSRVENRHQPHLLEKNNSLSWQTESSLQIAQQAYNGKASWYGGKFHGRLTASGEVFNSNALTAAHRTLPFGTRVRVTNINNGRSVIVRINDRGPFVKGRIIDVSAGAAQKLNMINSGTATVRLEILGK